MKTKPDVQALVLKQAGKEAVSILNKVDKMLKRGVARNKIESALTEELIVHLRKQIRLSIPAIDEIFHRP
jgi:hypothetical protein